ncbi:phage tail tube protein [Paenibacillus sp. PK4536]|uniref:Phage-like element PBSX protein XkdM n=2 Tax=Paenibacillus TaxID=44249 RepID=A0A1E3L8M9_9BACL|nr:MULTISPECIES: phage tail tube protein [Paenibacillus]ODP29941.1 Phage-like element PBSX protein XkdM [Paenibacillus nuruki]TKJ93320.1 phage portal protein [Paenibacillus sp. CFBP13512]WIM41347.1 phage tail tube protein [Paenibacillus sp. PK4536]
MTFLKAKDTISGQEGRAFATINNQVEEMFYIKTLEATVEKQKAEVKTLGRRGVQHKATGWSGSGTMTIFYMTSRFRQMMLDYMKTGVDTYFDIEVTNEDPTSSIGYQTITLRDVNLDSVIMASLDTESDALEEEVAFTFDGVDINNKFGTPAL